MWQGIIICLSVDCSYFEFEAIPADVSLSGLLRSDFLECVSHLTAELCSPAVLKEEIPRVLLTDCISGVFQAPASAGVDFKQGLRGYPWNVLPPPWV